LAGEKAKLTVVPKGKRITIIAALGRSGFVHTRMVESGTKNLAQAEERPKGTNAEQVRAFLTDLGPKIRQLSGNSPRSLLILDNAKIHHAEILQPTFEMLETTYGIIILFLSPYSPFFNPIEFAFNKLKALVQSDTFTNRHELIQSINKRIPDITPEDATGFYNQSAKYYYQAGMGLPFTGKPLNPDFVPAPNTDTPTPPTSPSTPTPALPQITTL
jgi:transposase